MYSEHHHTFLVRGGPCREIHTCPRGSSVIHGFCSMCLSNTVAIFVSILGHRSSATAVA